MCELWTRVMIEISDSSPGGLGDTLGHSGVVAVAFGFWRQGDVSETIRVFFEQSKSFPPAAKSLLTIQEVDEFLLRLSKLTKEDEQQQALQDIASRLGKLPSGNGLGKMESLGKESLGVQSCSKTKLNVPHLLGVQPMTSSASSGWLNMIWRWTQVQNMCKYQLFRQPWLPASFVTSWYQDFGVLICIWILILPSSFLWDPSLDLAQPLVSHI